MRLYTVISAVTACLFLFSACGLQRNELRWVHNGSVVHYAPKQQPLPAITAQTLTAAQGNYAVIPHTVQEAASNTKRPDERGKLKTTYTHSANRSSKTAPKQVSKAGKLLNTLIKADVAAINEKWYAGKNTNSHEPTPDELALEKSIKNVNTAVKVMAVIGGVFILLIFFALLSSGGFIGGPGVAFLFAGLAAIGFATDIAMLYLFLYLIFIRPKERKIMKTLLEQKG